ncbi:response regulator [Sabulicella rubraurantiaca]|uniref:response regulator n=1 Tax=Sabulicella rubraurantiaca TaxID=2811429 RepID=UPI001A964079|nr:response regulator [Sabulicella rubraurantiaca]
MEKAAASRDDRLVLLVEDDPDDVILMRRALRRLPAPLQVEHLEDGERAIARLADEQKPVPAVVLLDLKLPRLSGFEVLRWMRDQPRAKRVPVVVLTSSALKDDVGRAYDLGANSYLVKPGAPEALAAMMADVDRYWLTLNERPPFVAK